jgi:hypothetical protein
MQPASRLPVQQFEHVLRVFRVAVDRVGAAGYPLAGHAPHEILDSELVFGQ